MTDSTIFDPNTSTNATDDNSTNSTTPDGTDNNQSLNIPDQVKELIGEGRKYKTVEDALASITHAQEHISRIERENKELREDLLARVRLEEALKGSKGTGDDTSTVTNQSDSGASDNTPHNEKFVDPSAISEVVKSTVEELEAEKQAKQNLMEVDVTMKSKFGESAKQVLLNKAQELGVSVEYLTQTAATSPKAFFNLVGIDPSKGSETTQDPVSKITNSSETGVNNGASSDTPQPGTFKWYQKLRREDPVKYHSVEVQMEMHRKAKELGDKFYS